MFHDNNAKDPKIVVGDQVFVFFPFKKKGKSHKFARPFQDPYLVQEIYPNGVEVTRIGHPRVPSLRISLNRVRHCPDSWSRVELQFLIKIVGC